MTVFEDGLRRVLKFDLHPRFSAGQTIPSTSSLLNCEVGRVGAGYESGENTGKEKADKK